jgi:hypothetical protein
MVTNNNTSARQLFKHYHSYVISLLIILTVFSFGNFGFLNIFNLKLEINIFIILMLIPLSLYVISNKIKYLFNEPFFLLIAYLFISSLFIKNFGFLHSLHMLLSLIVVATLLVLDKKNINYIIKGIILLSSVFSIIGIMLFIYYQFNSQIIEGTERVYASFETYIDLSDVSLNNKFGFIIETAEKNLFGLEYIRSRSYCSEPSATIPIFFAIGILALLFAGIFKKAGIIILFFSVILVYSGASILAVLTGIFIFFIILRLNININVKILTIMLGSIFLYVLIYFIDITSFVYIPESKVSSITQRLTSVNSGIEGILKNPFVYLDKPINEFNGLFLLWVGPIPLIGISLTSYIFYRMLYYTITIYDKYKVFSILLIGLLLVVLFFSSTNWSTLTGLIILTIIYLKLKLEYEAVLITKTEDKKRINLRGKR